MARLIRHGVVETPDRFDKVAAFYDDMRKIESADIYWSDKHGAVILITTQDWKDHLMDRTKENKNEYRT